LPTYAKRHFSPYWEFIKLIMLLIIYLPLLLTESDPGVAWRLGAIGLFLVISLALRSLILPTQLPIWFRSLWLCADLGAWFISEVLTDWRPVRLPFAGFTLALDAAMIGWPYYRGFLHWLGATLFVVAGPLLWGFPFDLAYITPYGGPVLLGSTFQYVFIYLAGRMAEDREAAAKARQEAERARKEVELANLHLREYATQVEELAVLRERNRLAREVHDTIAHVFTGLHMQLELIESLLAEQPERVAPALAQVRERVGEGLNEVRRSVHALRPLQLQDDDGLGALQRLVDEFARTTGVTTDLIVTGLPVELPVAHQLCLYRAAQEGLTNAFRHGHARRCRLRLQYQADGVTLAVEDDGEGQPSTATAHGLGLTGIRERTGALGGRVIAGNAPTGGFVLQISLPIREEGAQLWPSA
jgi:signal transduction histidine kinase